MNAPSYNFKALWISFFCNSEKVWKMSQYRTSIAKTIWNVSKYHILCSTESHTRSGMTWGWVNDGRMIFFSLTACASVFLGLWRFERSHCLPLKLGRVHSLLFCLLFSYPHSREKTFHGAPAFVAWTGSKLRVLVCRRKVKLIDQ